ncbi:uncharacterized protein avpi1 [Betta splendens]|uniref:Arginine vasopressin-induced protein 1 n=1 Tax=Betta splendens TaxID=158456 RepID=A0A8M1H1N4_BETSP|nr:uncharacterized protein avpi1 [Betta splendens]
MAEVPASSSTEDDLSAQWKLSSQRSRKSGCSNIFSGINRHQLHKLFGSAGDGDAEHRAKLVWQSMEAEMENVEEREQVEQEAGLAQALVGLRVRARNKAGIRVEGYQDHKWLRTSGYLRFEEQLPPDHMLEGGEPGPTPSEGQSPSPAQGDVTDKQSTSKPPSWRLGVSRQEDARDCERYLHRILH